MGNLGAVMLAACAPGQPAASMLPSATPANTATTIPTLVPASSPTRAPSASVLPSATPANTATVSSTQVPASSPSQTPSALAASTAVAALPSCIVRPAQTEGPYFVDEKLNRTDIRSDPSDGSVKPGTPLRLVFRVSRVSNNACAPLAGVVVDVWHCDAAGIYSDVRDPGFNTAGKKFLRGYQQTDASGAAQFTTIFPGWYQGRTVHIHFKIRNNPATPGAGFDFTSQLYFDDALVDQVLAQPPYSGKGPRTMKNSGDSIFRSGGAQLIPAVVKEGPGYAATFDIGLQMG